MLTAALIYILGVIIPGANFILVSRYAAASSIRAGVGASVGIVMVSLLFSISAVSGLALLIERFPAFSRFATMAGALYLSYLAVLLIRSAMRPAVILGHEQAMRPTRFWTAWRRGVLTNIGNLKTIAFMISIFAEFLAGKPDLQAKTTLIASCSSAELLWYASVALIFGQGVMQRFYLKYSRQVDAGMALFLALFVVQSLLSSR